MNGNWHGHWVERYADGSVWEGPFVNDEYHGVWVRRDEQGANCWQRGERMEGGADALFACGFQDVDESMQAVEPIDVRLGPGDEYTLVGHLDAGQEVIVEAKSDEWLWILSAEGATIGYVRVSALEEKDAPLAPVLAQIRTMDDFYGARRAWRNKLDQDHSGGRGRAWWEAFWEVSIDFQCNYLEGEYYEPFKRDLPKFYSPISEPWTDEKDDGRRWYATGADFLNSENDTYWSCLVHFDFDGSPYSCIECTLYLHVDGEEQRP